ncbi:MAG: hypothetical protein QOF65_3101 [Thermoleophilaceae bacterium]|nr:hypothetical protein [Thermoleophilaceae bacterium]
MRSAITTPETVPRTEQATPDAIPKVVHAETAATRPPPAAAVMMTLVGRFANLNPQRTTPRHSKPRAATLVEETATPVSDAAIAASAFNAATVADEPDM